MSEKERNPMIPSPPAVPLAQEPIRTLGKERIALSGRVESLPSFSQLPNGNTVAHFSIREQHIDGETFVRQVTAFGKQAEQLRESLSIGQEVSIAGYDHTRRLRDKTGRVHTVRELYLSRLTK
jgi:single-stranded DNA-binding protein